MEKRKTSFFRQKIILVEESSDSIISNEIEVAGEVNKYFSDIVKNLNIVKYIRGNEQSNVDIYEIKDKNSQHPSILEINEYIGTSDIFNFTYVTTEEMNIGIKKLKTNKATETYDITAKILIKSHKITSVY